MRLLVTGAGGFVGGAVVRRCAVEAGLEVRATSRRDASGAPDVPFVRIGELGPDTDWSTALVGVETVVHAAARVHVLRESRGDPLTAFRQANVHGTLELARQSIRAGVRRFVFISSIGVNGAETFGAPFTADDAPAPHSPYVISKHEAENGLLELRRMTGLEVIIIRPPLVIGPGAPGNFERLLRIIHAGVPLPFGAIHNARSFVALDNLVDLIVTCATRRLETNPVLLVSDGQDVSTPALVRLIAHGMGRDARLFAVPAWIIRAAARAVGKSDAARQLCGSLRIDARKTREHLGWTPRMTTEDAVASSVAHYMNRQPHLLK